MCCIVQRDGVSKSSESNNNELHVLFADRIIPNARRRRRRGVALIGIRQDLWASRRHLACALQR